MVPGAGLHLTSSFKCRFKCAGLLQVYNSRLLSRDAPYIEPHICFPYIEPHICFRFARFLTNSSTIFIHTLKTADLWGVPYIYIYIYICIYVYTYLYIYMCIYNAFAISPMPPSTRSCATLSPGPQTPEPQPKTLNPKHSVLKPLPASAFRLPKAVRHFFHQLF